MMGRQTSDQSQLFHLFNLERRIPAGHPGLVKVEGFAVDASVMEASASRYHGKAPDEIAWAEPERQTRAVKEYLAALKPRPA